MKTLFLIIFLSSFIAFANEENIEYYHQEKPIAENAQRPSIPKILAPTPLSLIAASSSELKWGKVEEASAYALQVSADPIFYSLLVNETLYKETSYSLKYLNLESGKNYYWRVAAIKEGNQIGTIKSLFNRSSFTAK